MLLSLQFTLQLVQGCARVKHLRATILPIWPLGLLVPLAITSVRLRSCVARFPGVNHDLTRLLIRLWWRERPLCLVLFVLVRSLSVITVAQLRQFGIRPHLHLTFASPVEVYSSLRIHVRVPVVLWWMFERKSLAFGKLVQLSAVHQCAVTRVGPALIPHFGVLRV